MPFIRLLGKFSEAGGQGVRLSHEPVGKDSSCRALGLDVSFGKCTGRVWCTCVLTFSRANSPTEPACPNIKLGDVEEQAGLNREILPQRRKRIRVVSLMRVSAF